MSGGGGVAGQGDKLLGAVRWMLGRREAAWGSRVSTESGAHMRAKNRGRKKQDYCHGIRPRVSLGAIMLLHG